MSTIYHKICANPDCGKEFDTTTAKKIYCCEKCHQIAEMYKQREIRIQKLLPEGVENEDYVIDRWNGLPTPRIYGKWTKTMHPGRTMEEYRTEFPDAPIQSTNDRKRTTANSGKHMKEEKYKKTFSEKFKGENNPRHHSRISEQEIRENSPYCEEFYTKRGINASFMNLVKEKNIKNRTPDKQTANIEYYLAKGMTLQEADDALSERQKTFTLESVYQNTEKKRENEDSTNVRNDGR